MKPTYLLALFLAVIAGVGIVWTQAGSNSGWPLFVGAMAPSVIVVIAAILDPPKEK